MGQRYVLHFSLLDTEGRECFTIDSKADPRQWLPGEYAVVEAIGALVDPTSQRSPFHLAIAVQQDGDRYPVSRVTLD